MPGAIDALKNYVFGKPKAEDLELPMPKGGKRDPRLPKESSIAAGFRLMKDTMAPPPPPKGKK